jgi:hypothetical protein
VDVFVIPIAAERYELYCETPIEPVSAEPPRGIVNRVRHRITVMLHAAEERRHAGHQAPEPASFRDRLQARAMAWVAERVAEQRLLWNLRGERQVALSHPSMLTSGQAVAVARRLLQHDHNRHRRWMIIDGILFVVTFVALGPLFLLIPGVANLPALYFGFRTVGHWLSMRGAAHGMRAVAWEGRACPPLDALREAVAMPAGAREARIHDVAAQLHLEHLATFFERVAVPHA